MPVCLLSRTDLVTEWRMEAGYFHERLILLEKWLWGLLLDAGSKQRVRGTVDLSNISVIEHLWKRARSVLFQMRQAVDQTFSG
jgi:hypothetical protein